MLQLSIIRHIDAKLLDELATFRYRIWVNEGAQFKDPAVNASKRWMDPVDLAPTAMHWIIRDQGRIVAAARMSLHAALQDIPDNSIFRHTMTRDDRPMSALNRLVVDKDYRCRGLGRFLDAQRINMACALGARLLMVEAVGDKRCLQLMRQGFEIDSAHGQDEDISFQTPKTYYALIGKPENFHHESLAEACRSLGIQVMDNQANADHRQQWAANFS